MSTTTIRLPASLKDRICVVARRSGKTAHDLILEAIAEKAELEERRNNFNDEANAPLANLLAFGKTHSMGRDASIS